MYDDDSAFSQSQQIPIFVIFKTLFFFFCCAFTKTLTWLSKRYDCTALSFYWLFESAKFGDC